MGEGGCGDALSQCSPGFWAPGPGVTEDGSSTAVRPSSQQAMDHCWSVAQGWGPCCKEYRGLGGRSDGRGKRSTGSAQGPACCIRGEPGEVRWPVQDRQGVTGRQLLLGEQTRGEDGARKAMEEAAADVQAGLHRGARKSMVGKPQD